MSAKAFVTLVACVPTTETNYTWKRDISPFLFSPGNLMMGKHTASITKLVHTAGLSDAPIHLRARVMQIEHTSYPTIFARSLSLRGNLR